MTDENEVRHQRWVKGSAIVGTVFVLAAVGVEVAREVVHVPWSEALFWVFLALGVGATFEGRVSQAWITGYRFGQLIASLKKLEPSRDD